MKFAVIGDIHSNTFALESVLEDIRLRKIQKVFCTGDIVGYMPFPNEVIEIIKRQGLQSVKGNHDEVIANGERINPEELNVMSPEDIHKNASKIFTNWAITEENRNYLKELPDRITFKCEGKKIMIVHGSPNAIDEYMYEDECILQPIADNVDADVVIVGHTHVAYARKYQNKYFINAGSVGKPKHGNPLSSYVIVEITLEKVNTEIIQVPYHLEAMKSAILDNDMVSNKLITNLEKGQ